VDRLANFHGFPFEIGPLGAGLIRFSAKIDASHNIFEMRLLFIEPAFQIV